MNAFRRISDLSKPLKDEHRGHKNQNMSSRVKVRQNLSKHLKARQIEYVNRVRDKDVPYMTPEWKSAIRAKRKANAKYLKNKTQETWELRRKTRNEATKQRRIAIKNYWKIKAADLKSNPRDFFKTFKPFLNTKDC